MVALFSLLLLAPTAQAENADLRVQSRENPFSCVGAYEALTGGGRTLDEMRDELRALLARLESDSREKKAGPDVDRAAELCVAGRLKARLGHQDASDLLEAAIRAAPHEPGYELFAGMYWAGMRGARRPLLERAERHFYAGLAKLKDLRARGQALSFHDVVEDWLHKQLLVLYQEDGAQLLPWKAYRPWPGGRWAPGLAFSSQLRFAQDTRDFFYNSEMRQFTGEAAFASSDLRAGAAFDARDAWDLVRAPHRFEVQNRLRLRHAWLGALDALHSYMFSPQSQIQNFYDPQSALSDVTVFLLGLGYERGFSLYPLFDLRLAGSFSRGTRRGTVEFEPQELEHFNQLEAHPSFSRFFGSDKVTLDLSYVLIDLADAPSGVVDDRLRRRDIRAARLEYALYSPLLLPSFSDGDFGLRRTATRGWYFYVGAVDDREAWGVHTLVRRDLFAGTRYNGPGRFEITVQGTYYTSNTRGYNPNRNPPLLYSEVGQDYSSARLSLLPQIRLVDQETLPGVPQSALGFGVDMLNLVFPLHADRALDGGRDFENLRGGMELWMKVFGTGFGGPAVLLTLGYDFQYFYRLQKSLHLAQVALRLGWGRL